MALQNLFVPRARIATFDVALRIEDLNNIPPLDGLFYAKWRCQARGDPHCHPPVHSHVRNKIGELTINLSEYARLAASSRRYFLHECKLNCTLKLSITVAQVAGPDGYDAPPLDRSMLLTDLNHIIASEGGARSARDTSSVGNSLSSQLQLPARRAANMTSASSTHSATTQSNTTGTSHSRALLPIDNTDLRELAPLQRSSRKNQQIIDDVFLESPSLPT
ncbi:hypothetical protein IWQ57_006198 [Coemansia nantahalensis]|uniref:Uncharacterized protein n=1 Tax=Coemansia nantahalensis TaxID=2789366 RepID=A0ACC1JKI9_9FUNG|nr:hypothetical protein IWQ57_006198 [Coemansia nantahalensis]